ncbi:MAG TPA: transposase [Xanthobacteraceae bacterium]|jgi:IS1 family transposase|nr:transposase [Xanthobacteraceae bacterium]
MNNLPRDKQIEIIGMLCEGVGQRAVSRLTGTDRKTVARLALAVGTGCAELHDRMMVGLRVHRIECDELWAYVGHKRNPQKGGKRNPSPVFGDQYTYVALASATRAIIGYWTGKRDTATTDDFIQDLRQRVIGAPEISTDGLHFYKNAIRDAFGKRATHGVINKTYSVTHLNVTEASRRYSPAAVVAVERIAVAGEPEHISTSYVERSNLTLRMASKRFARLSNGFSKKIDCHVAAVGLYVAFYNLCRTHEALKMTPAMALGIADRVWSIGDLIEAALKAVPTKPTPTPAQRRRSFRVIQGDLFD